LSQKKRKIKELETRSQNPDFWINKNEAIKINQELTDLKEEQEEADKLKKELNDLEELIKIATGDNEEIEEIIKEFEKKLKEKENKKFFSGKYDKGSAILTIYAGAGGQDAQDWVTMLLRMYERYCQKKGFNVKILEQAFSEAGGPEGRIGTKQVSLEVKGNYSFGFLKKESGIHRLVRLSPFSSKSLRHTSFALVEVLPEINEEEIKIKPEDLKIDTFRASGPGGQYVNKRESAVRIIHLPTKIQVSCQSERLQGLNREKAMKILKAKLYQLKEEEKRKKIKETKGKYISIGWGNQIRSYVLHPYKMVKDLRTGIESSAVEKILDGEIDEFIEAELKIYD
jgi:peptide chain release factor 2